MNWNIKELTAAIRKNQKERIVRLCSTAAESVAWKYDMYCYHSLESINLLKDSIYQHESIPKTDPEWVAAMKTMFISGMPGVPDIDEISFKAEAQMIAAAQSLHSTADIMGAVIYWALNLEQQQTKFSEHNVDLNKIHRYLIGHPDCKPIAGAILKLFDLQPYKYLNGYVNMTKHRSLVKAPFTAHVNPVDNPRQGLRICAFDYGKSETSICHYDEVWGKDFLFADLKQVAEGIVTIGNALNAHCKAVV